MMDAPHVRARVWLAESMTGACVYTRPYGAYLLTTNARRRWKPRATSVSVGGCRNGPLYANDYDACTLSVRPCVTDRTPYDGQIVPDLLENLCVSAQCVLPCLPCLGVWRCSTVFDAGVLCESDPAGA